MSEHEIDLLKRICSGEVMDYRTLSPMDLERLNSFKSQNLVEIYNAGFFDVKTAAHDLLSELEQAANKMAQQKADDDRRRERDRAHAAKENRKNRHHDYFVTAFELLIAYIIGVVSEAEFDVAAFIINFFEEVLAFFH